MSRGLRAVVVDRLRRDPVWARLVTRLARTVPGAAGPFDAAYPPAGRLVAGTGVPRLPVVVVGLLGLDEAAAAQAVEEVARVQLLTAGFRPVLLLDRAGLGVARRYGYLGELLVPPEDWAEAGEPWESYAARRLADLRVSYRASGFLALRGPGLAPVERAYLAGLTLR